MSVAPSLALALGAIFFGTTALFGNAPVIAQAGPAGPSAAGDTRADLIGAWGADRYLLASGADYRVEGRIFFAERDWTVLFFVMDEDGVARRGSAEGGGYTVTGDRLVFTHLYNLSAGEGMPGLAASDLRMIVRAETDAPEEPTRIDVEGERLTLFFPSGNQMTFGRR